MTNQSTSFWIFSNQLYDTNGVAEICLQLQAEFDLDVNLILLCLWLAQYDINPSDDAWNELLMFSQEWKSHVVQPLRSTRQWMKDQSYYQENDADYTRLRDQIKNDELAAEKFQQEIIVRSLGILEISEPNEDQVSLFSERANNLFSKLLYSSELTLEGEVASQLGQLVLITQKKQKSGT